MGQRRPGQQPGQCTRSGTSTARVCTGTGPGDTVRPAPRGAGNCSSTACWSDLAKPHMFRQIAIDTARVDSLLEPLTLAVRLDDHRGLAFVAIAATYRADGEDEDEWTHPGARQRLTLSSRCCWPFCGAGILQREQESGLGVPVHLSV